MKLRLPVLALLMLSYPLFCHAQSLGDVAREVRVEKQKSGAPHAKVITNDDLVAPASQEKATAAENDASSAADADAAAKDATAKPGEAGKQEGPDATSKPGKKNAKKSAEKEREEQEAETQKRSDEINKRYTDRITTLHEKINEAQLLLAKLQSQQVESTNEFRRTAAMAPTYSEYESQQRDFNERIAAQKELITSLNAQLEDAREAARHAGVPHALDY